MRRTIILTALFLAFSALSCNKAENPVLGSDDQVTVSYRLSFDQQTKAIGEGETVNYVWCAAYKVIEDNGTVKYTLSSSPVLEPIVSGEADCSVTMVRDQSYKVVFVAQYYDQDKMPIYELNQTSATIHTPTTPLTNSDHYDVFGCVDEVEEFNGYIEKSVELSRLVAQINFVADQADIAAAEAAGKTPTHSRVTLAGVPNYISLLDGSSSSTTKTVEYALAPLTGIENQLATVFCLSPQSGNDVTSSLYIYKGTESTDKLKEYISVAKVPCKPNYKTNVKVSYTF